jgi:Fe-S-cluster containining protein
MALDIQRWKLQARQDRKQIQQYFSRLRRKVPRSLDEVTGVLHEKVFEEMDCLTCANCCKTTSPIFRDKDIERIAKHLGLRPAVFVDRFLHLDEEEDYVLNVAPCPFLGVDNYCAIYEVRPKACREYPHTDRKNFHQIFDLTLRNTQVCPAAYEVVRRLQEVLPA